MKEWIHWLPRLNAIFNFSSGVFLIFGYAMIRKRRVMWHRFFMLSALAMSILFLISYLYYHAQVGTTRYTGMGWMRTVYFFILGTHTILAMVLVPMVGITVTRALRGSFDRHRRVARWTLPIWIYVSITGVLVYFFLYVWMK